MTTEIVAYSATGAVRFATDGTSTIVNVSGGHAFQWPTTTEARAFLNSALAALDHEQDTT